MEKIGSFQFASLMVLFQIGSYVIFGFASSAKQDAWLVALVSTGSGLVLALLYTKLYRLHPGLDMVGVFRRSVGALLGNALGLCYVGAFVYVSGRVLRDFGTLINTFALPTTPLVVIMLLLLVVSFVGLQAGGEVISRFALFAWFVFGLFVVAQSLLLLGSDVLDFRFLLPVGHERQEILKSLVPLGITVPFGENIAFLMMYHQLQDQRDLNAVVFGSVGFAGLLLTWLNVLGVTTLGPTLYARTVYPLLTTLQQVTISDLVENLDVLVVLYIGIAAFIKITVFLYAASLGTASVFRLHDYRVVLIPLTVLVLMLATYMSQSVSEHVFIGLQWVPWVLWVPLFILIPSLVYIVGRLRGGGRPDAEETQATTTERERA